MKNFQLILISVLSLYACGRTEEPISADTPPLAEESMEIELSTEESMLWCDLFLYENTGLRKLVRHSRTNERSVCWNCPVGEYLAVAVANCPGTFNEAALGRFDALEALSFSYCDDNSEHPLMSALSAVCSSEHCTLQLDPLLCEIRLSSIDSSLELSDMQIWLENVNAEAEVMRWSNFHISSMLNCGGLLYGDYSKMRHRKMLMRNIPSPSSWRYTYHPDVSLWCYPNDSDDGIASAATAFVLKASVGDEPFIYKVELPPLGRACVCYVELSIHGLAGCDCDHLVDVVN